MSVGRRLSWSLAALVMCTALLGGAAIGGLVGLNRHAKMADDRYQGLRSLYEIGHRAAVIGLLIKSEAPSDGAIEQNLLHILRLCAELEGARAGDADAIAREVQRTDAMVREYLLRPTGDGAGGGVWGLHAELNRVQNQVAALAGVMEAEIRADRDASIARYRGTLVVMVSLFAATIVAALLVGLTQYRAIMRPIRTLDRALTLLQDARLGHRVEVHGDREFRRLMGHLNRTSEALARLTESMQAQVEAKSRQLIRSEQLASVGFLAAGLAHEINNPLGIIAGYSEASLRRLQRADSAGDHADAARHAARTLETICQEAFRCRDITRDLLLLARPGEHEPTPTRLLPLAERAAALVRVLPAAKGKAIEVRSEGAEEDLVCLAHPPRLLQVFINLLTNALEACAPGEGRVTISVERRLQAVAVVISDNGQGMSREQLDHAFDPFFTDKPAKGLAGNGLGLTISHAIVECLGGRIEAHSAGPARGCTMTVELPIAALAEGGVPCAASTR